MVDSPENPPEGTGSADNLRAVGPLVSQEVHKMDMAEMKTKTISDLLKVAKDLDIQGVGGLKKQELIFKILEAQTEKNGLMFSQGVLEPRGRQGAHLL
jgi:hypothetical protein